MKTVNKSYFVLLSLVLCISVSCHVNENADMSGIVDKWNEIKPQPIDTLVFNHPCAMYTQDDFDRVSRSLENGSAPQAVKDEFAALKANQLVMGDYGITSHATVEVVRGDAKGTMEGKENYGAAMRDAAAAYQFGLLWNLTKEEQYAQRGIFILNDWAAKCERVTSYDSNH